MKRQQKQLLLLQRQQQEQQQKMLLELQRTSENTSLEHDNEGQILPEGEFNFFILNTNLFQALRRQNRTILHAHFLIFVVVFSFEIMLWWVAMYFYNFKTDGGTSTRTVALISLLEN